MKFSPLLVAGVLIALTSCSSAPDPIHTQALTGRPVARAIERYHRHTGNYPASLDELIPSYMETVPKDWEYHLIKNGDTATYTLKQGVVEYEPPNWYKTDNGQKTVIFTESK